MGQAFTVHYFTYEKGIQKYLIWGLTARILIHAASVVYQRPPDFPERIAHFKLPKFTKDCSSIVAGLAKHQCQRCYLNYAIWSTGCCTNRVYRERGVQIILCHIDLDFFLLQSSSYTIVAFMYRRMFIYDARQNVHVDAVDEFEHLLGCHWIIYLYVYIRLFY